MLPRLAAALAAVAVSAALPAAAAPERPPRLAVLDFTYLDTSGEARPQQAEHAARLSAMTEALRRELGEDGPYEVVAAPDAAACPAGDSACILEAVRGAGADLVLAGGVHKLSTLVSNVAASAFAAEDGRQLFHRRLTFRGDTDEAWGHAARFLVRQIEDAPPLPGK